MGSHLAAIVENVDAMRADLAELRHEMRRELDGIKGRLEMVATRLDAAVTRLDATVTRLDTTVAAKGDIHALRAELRAEFKDGLLLQTRWMLAGVVTVLLAIFFRA